MLSCWDWNAEPLGLEITIHTAVENKLMGLKD